MDTPISTPLEGIQLELGVLSIGTIIKACCINFLHYLLTLSENDMLRKVFMQQWSVPVKLDWTEQVKIDLQDFNIRPNLEEIKGKSKNSFKRIVKIKAREFELSQLLKKKQKHSKMASLNYGKLEMQEYLKLNNINSSMAKILFKYRTRMANYGENFRAGNGLTVCPMCSLHLDSQVMAYNNCPVIKREVTISGNYNDIFKKTIPNEVVKTLYHIELVREENKK